MSNTERVTIKRGPPSLFHPNADLVPGIEYDMVKIGEEVSTKLLNGITEERDAYARNAALWMEQALLLRKLIQQNNAEVDKYASTGPGWIRCFTIPLPEVKE